MNPIAIGMIVLGLVVLILSLRFVRKHERGVIFRLGRLVGVTGSGLCLIIPFIDRMVKVDPKVEPTDDFGYYLRGIIYASLGRKSDAIANLEKYLSSLGPPDEATRETVKRMIEELRVQGYLTIRNIREGTSQRMVVGNIIIDKPTKSIITRKKFIFFGRRRIIPFSDVLGVMLYEKPLSVGQYLTVPGIQLCINYTGEKHMKTLVIKHEREDRRAALSNLAAEILKFIGK